MWFCRWSPGKPWTHRAGNHKYSVLTLILDVFCSRCWLLSSCISFCGLWKSKRRVATLMTCFVWGQVILPTQWWLPRDGIFLLMRMRMWGRRDRRWRNINQDKQDPWVTESHGPLVTKRLIVKSREISNPRDWMLWWSNVMMDVMMSAAAEVPVNFQSDWKNFNPKRSSETSRDLTVRHPSAYSE